MPDEYAYKVAQCAVPPERRAALESFRGKRCVWISWLDTDEHHAVWTTLHSMVWTDVSFRTLRGFALSNDENALNNPLIIEALLRGHAATQVLAIRRLMEVTQKDRISLRRLVADLKRRIASAMTACPTTIKPFGMRVSMRTRARGDKAAFAGCLPLVPTRTLPLN